MPDALLELGAQFDRGLGALSGFLGEHAGEEIAHGFRQPGEFVDGGRGVEMMAHHLGEGAAEGGLGGEHVPEGDAEGINVRSGVEFQLLELLRGGEMRGADKAGAGHGDFAGDDVFAAGRLGEAEVDDLYHQLLVLVDEHEIGGLDVAMDELVFLRGIEGARDLDGDAQGEDGGQFAAAPDEGLDGLPLDEFHRIKISVALDAEMEDGADVAMPKLRGGPGLADEALAGDVAVDGAGVDDLQRDGAAEIGIEGLVGNAHGAAAELKERAILAAQHLVMIKNRRLGHEWP